MLLLFLALSLAIVLGILMTWGLLTRPEIVFMGFTTLSGVLLCIILLSSGLSVVQFVFTKKNYPNLLNNNMSLQDRLNSQRELHSLDDPYLRKLSKEGFRGGIILLLSWLIVFLTIIFGAFVFRVFFFVKIMDYFK